MPRTVKQPTPQRPSRLAGQYDEFVTAVGPGTKDFQQMTAEQLAELPSLTPEQWDAKYRKANLDKPVG